jgi:hypothetical protein
MADVQNMQRGQITGAQLAVDTEIEKSQLPYSLVHLQTDPDCSDLLRLEGSLLSDELALVPGFPVLGRVVRFHGDHLA